MSSNVPFNLFDNNAANDVNLVFKSAGTDKFNLGYVDNLFAIATDADLSNGKIVTINGPEGYNGDIVLQVKTNGIDTLQNSLVQITGNQNNSSPIFKLSNVNGGDAADTAMVFESHNNKYISMGYKNSLVEDSFLITNSLNLRSDEIMKIDSSKNISIYGNLIHETNSDFEIQKTLFPTGSKTILKTNSSGTIKEFGFGENSPASGNVLTYNGNEITWAPPSTANNISIDDSNSTNEDGVITCKGDRHLQTKQYLKYIYNDSGPEPGGKLILSNQHGGDFNRLIKFEGYNFRDGGNFMNNRANYIMGIKLIDDEITNSTCIISSGSNTVSIDTTSIIKIGMGVSSSNSEIPGNTTIISIIDATSFIMSANATATINPVTLTFTSNDLGKFHIGSNQTLQFTVNGSQSPASGSQVTLTINAVTHAIPNGTVFNLFNGNVSSTSDITFTSTVAALKNDTSIQGDIVNPNTVNLNGYVGLSTYDLFDKNFKSGLSIDHTGAFQIAGLDLSEGNISNAGNINCDSITVDEVANGLTLDFAGNPGTNKIILRDNLADALNIIEEENSYMKFVTTDGSESIHIGNNSVSIINEFSQDKSYTIKNTNDDLKITLTDNNSTPANEKIIVTNTNGTNTDAISFIASAGGITLNSAKGITGTTNVLSKNVSYTSNNDIRSGAMTVPANSLITNIAVVVTTELTHSFGDTTCKVGTSANSDNIASSVNFDSSSANTAVGKGTAIDTKMTTALEGDNPLVITAGKVYRSLDTDIHITVKGHSNQNAGAVQFIIEYIKF